MAVGEKTLKGTAFTFSTPPFLWHCQDFFFFFAASLTRTRLPVPVAIYKGPVVPEGQVSVPVPVASESPVLHALKQG